MQEQEDVPRSGTENRQVLDGLTERTVATLGKEGAERSSHHVIPEGT